MAPGIITYNSARSTNMAPGGVPSDEESDADSGWRPNYVPRNMLTALVVDDDNTCRNLEQAYLHSCGVIVQGVVAGEEALHLFAAGADFDILVIELLLPGINGLETIRRIRAMGIPCKILAVTAAEGDRHRRAFMAAGADVFIVKPLTPDHLIPILEELDDERDDM